MDGQLGLLTFIHHSALTGLFLILRSFPLAWFSFPLEHLKIREKIRAPGNPALTSTREIEMRMLSRASYYRWST
jgi:hypothetical protein